MSEIRQRSAGNGLYELFERTDKEKLTPQEKEDWKLAMRTAIGKLFAYSEVGVIHRPVANQPKGAKLYETVYQFSPSSNIRQAKVYDLLLDKGILTHIA